MSLLEKLALILTVVCFLSVTVVPLIAINLKYKAGWHRWRKNQYRVVQTTISTSYSEEVSVQYIIQKKGFRGWRDNPSIPGYDHYGDCHLWSTQPFEKLETAQWWMDRITAVVSGAPARKDNVVI